MNRRDVLKTGVAGLAASALARSHMAHATEPKLHRVGLIGCGWYGKSDLFRLIQVAPVEVVSLCDPDKHQLEGAAKMVAERQKSKQSPRTHTDYREMLKQKDLDIVLIGTPNHWHALTISWRPSPAAASRWRTSKKDTSRPPPASWRISRCNWAGR